MKLLGIIGDPIRHSLSPRMQNAALQKKRLPYFYVPFQVAPSQLAKFLKEVRDQGLQDLVGFNVTIPHKEKIIPLLDSISPEARAIGAVNTVVVRKGKLHGHNTDAIGYLKSLKEETRFHPRGKTILILGAGGASHAVVYGLASQGAREILITNRTLARAKKLVQSLKKKFKKTKFEAIALKPNLLSEVFTRVDLLINTTSVGLKGTRFKKLPLQYLPPRALVSDLVYRPLFTPLLKESKRRKLRVHFGLGMLLHQGAESFRLWTRKNPDLIVMKKALLAP